DIRPYQARQQVQTRGDLGAVRYQQRRAVQAKRSHVSAAADVGQFASHDGASAEHEAHIPGSAKFAEVARVAVEEPADSTTDGRAHSDGAVPDPIRLDRGQAVAALRRLGFPI